MWIRSFLFALVCSALLGCDSQVAAPEPEGAVPSAWGEVCAHHPLGPSSALLQSSSGPSDSQIAQACACLMDAQPEIATTILQYPEASSPLGNSQTAVEWNSEVHRCLGTVGYQVEVPTAAVEQSISMKGLKIGMDIEEAAKILRERLSAAQVAAWQDNAVLRALGTQTEGIVVRPGGAKMSMVDAAWHVAVGVSVEIAADEDRLVKYVYLGSDVTDFLFNTSDLDPRAFAEEFTAGYGIPHMEFVSLPPNPTLGDISYWIYRDPRGSEVKLTVSKALSLTRIPSAAERSFD